jgi:flagellar hook protein FlgE
MSTGVSGLTTYSALISVIGNNIANVNTPGFKEARGSFTDILHQSLGGNSDLQVGRGVQMNSVDTLFSQGSFKTTSIPTDLAIDGDGFFLVKEPNANTLFYTRTGDFVRDRDGNLVNPRGLILQGFAVDEDGNATPVLTDMNISDQTFPPKATASTTVSLNLDARTPAMVDGSGAVVPFDPTNTEDTSNFSTALTIYDSLGNPHTVSIYTQKTADNTWNWFVTSPTSELEGLTGTEPVTLAQGQMTFTPTGALDTLTTTARINYATGVLTALATQEQGASVMFNFAQGAQQNQAVTFDFGTPRQTFDGSGFVASANSPTGFEGTVQFGAVSAASFQSQDGFTSGALRSFTIDTKGVVQGQFTNGQSRPLLQVALAKFPSPPGLTAVGNNLFAQSFSSGEPVIAAPSTGGLGGVVSSALENSTVDLSAQFVELIQAQQAFQANAKVITVGDELLTTVVNIRR